MARLPQRFEVSTGLRTAPAPKLQQSRLKNHAGFVALSFVMLRSLLTTDDTPPAGLAFTNYVLRLPGEDKITGN